MREQIKREHRKLIRQGKFYHARRLMDLLRNGSISCGLSDVAWEVSELLEDMGMKSRISRNGNSQTFTLSKESQPVAPMSGFIADWKAQYMRTAPAFVGVN